MRLKEIIESWESFTRSPEENRLHFLRGLAEHISYLSITLEAPADDDGLLYQPISSLAILRALIDQHGMHIPSVIVKHGDFERIGSFSVRLLLGDGVETSLKTWVVPLVEEEEYLPPAQRLRRRVDADDGRNWHITGTNTR